MGGVQTNVWQMKTVNYTRANTYTMFVEAATGKPKRYEMHGYNTLTGSHYDKYYLDYSDMNTNFSSDEVFKKPDGRSINDF